MVAVIESFLPAGAMQPTKDSSWAPVRAFGSMVAYLPRITFSFRIGLIVFEAELLSFGADCRLC